MQHSTLVRASAAVILGAAIIPAGTGQRSASATALAQKPAGKASQSDRQGDKPQLGVLTVRLPLSVKNKDKPVIGLTVNNFQVFEDNKQQRIEGFEAPSRLPLDIAILMDTSESVKLKLPFEKDAAEDFISNVATGLPPSRTRKDQMLFATFDSSVELQQDFTNAQEPLIKAIRKVKAGGYTRLYDAVYRVIEEKMAGLQGSEARRIILILSDGSDTASDRSLKDAIEMGQRFDVTIFGITTKNFTGITSGMVESSDDKEMRRLCEETGGQIFLPSQKSELFRAFAQVAEDLRQEYVLFYTPQNQEKSGKKRVIKVKLVGASGHLFHKQGYTY